MRKRSPLSELFGNKHEKPLIVIPKNAYLEAIVEAVVHNAFKGGLCSLLFDVVAHFLCSAVADPLPGVTALKAYTDPSRHLGNARNFAVLKGVDAGLTCAIKKLRGKEDLHTKIVAGFGAGVMYSVVRGDREPVTVISFGVMYALFSGGSFQIRKSKEDGGWWTD
ncbi:mitochondrial inner membrane translocase subunit [Tanacetum coccineum]